MRIPTIMDTLLSGMDVSHGEPWREVSFVGIAEQYQAWLETVPEALRPVVHAQFPPIVPGEGVEG